jgi:hypothetical protein
MSNDEGEIKVYLFIYVKKKFESSGNQNQDYPESHILVVNLVPVHFRLDPNWRKKAERRVFGTSASVSK